MRTHVCTRCPVLFSARRPLHESIIRHSADDFLFVMCSPVPQIHKTLLRDVSFWELEGLFLLRLFFRCSGRGLKTMNLPSWSVQVFFSLSPCSRGPCHDLVSVLRLVGLVPVVFSHHVRRHIPFLAWLGLSFWSVQVFSLSLFQKRSDTDMLWSTCFELKTEGYGDTLVEIQ